MDILSLIKSEQEVVLNSLSEPWDWDTGDTTALKKRLKQQSAVIRDYLTMDKEFLYLEIGEVLPNASRLVEYGQHQHSRIESLINSADQSISGEDRDRASQASSSLTKEVTAHIRYQQEHIIPQMREVFPTQDREDLAEVFQDLKEEWTQRKLQENKTDQAMS